MAESEEGHVPPTDNTQEKVASASTLTEGTSVWYQPLANAKTTTETTTHQSIPKPRVLHLKDTNNYTYNNKCHIINNSFAKNRKLSLKKQYEIDEKVIGDTFARLNFEIKVKRDVDHPKMEKFLRKLYERDHDDTQCIVFFILSHGTRKGEIVLADRRLYRIDDMIAKIQNIHTLHDKPKLFFVQACRGEMDSEVVEVPKDTRAAGATVRVAKKSNTFVYYSTTQGDRSYCSNKTGSFFVEKLTQVLNERAEM